MERRTNQVYCLPALLNYVVDSWTIQAVSNCEKYVKMEKKLVTEPLYKSHEISKIQCKALIDLSIQLRYN